MSNIQYSKWSQLTNPTLGTFTNPLVNFNAGVIVTQTIPGPTHVLPNGTSIGKEFGIVNNSVSTEPFFVQIMAESGPTSFAIMPGDSAIFRWVGNGVWEETSGETLFGTGNTFITLPDTPLVYTGSGGLFVRVNAAENAVEFAPSQAIITRTINFDDAPDSGLATFNIGTPIAATSRITRVALEVTTPFDDATAINATVDATSGLTTLMAAAEINIQQAGTYLAVLSGAQVSGGQLSLSFNAAPDGNGGTQGSLTVVIEYT